MTVKLSIEIASPLTPDDKDLLAGIAVITLSIANRELAAQGFPEAFPPEEPKEPRAHVCCHVDDLGRVCVDEPGHEGIHHHGDLIADVMADLAKGLN